MLTSFFKVEGVLIAILFKNSSEFQRVHLWFSFDPFSYGNVGNKDLYHLAIQVFKIEKYR